jgi:hypothetical protein
MVFASAKEAKRYRELKLLESAGEISELNTQVKFEVVEPSLLFRGVYYVADFVYHDKNGSVVVEDVKGCKKGAAYNIFEIKKKLMYNKYGIMVIEI